LVENSTLGHNRKEYSVSEISALLKKTIELNFNFITVRGEISGLKVASSGHIYFSLKDQQAVLSAVCWKGLSNKLSVKLEEGLEIVCTGTVSIFNSQSKYQLIVEEVELAGVGALMLLLEKRKKQLESEGLFATSKKRKIPFLPKRIGIITSPTGAVIKDMLHRISARCPTKIILWPVLVQGDGASAQIANAIDGFNKLENDDLTPDVIIVARGGGSIEDLWPFNEEIVVRATANSRIPIISAIGHETDTTLIDFASDLRAPTPTAAAEFAVPILQDLYLKIYDLFRFLHQQVFQKLLHKKNYLHALTRGLTSPKSQLLNISQKIDDLSFRLETILPRLVELKFHKLKEVAAHVIKPYQQLYYHTQLNTELSKRLTLNYKIFLYNKSSIFNSIATKLTSESLVNYIEIKRIILQNLYQNLTNSIQNIILYRQQTTFNLASLLNCFSYQKTLERGYVILMTPENEIIDQKVKFDRIQQVKILFKDGEAQFNK
jgi:exodeoxyribonuclease VII large subunit